MGILTSFIINHKPSVYHNFTKLKCLRAWACPRLLKSWHKRKTQIYNRMAPKAARNPNSLVGKSLEKTEDVSIQSIRDKLIIHLHQNRYKLTLSLQWQTLIPTIGIFPTRQTKTKKGKAFFCFYWVSFWYMSQAHHITLMFESNLKKASKAPVSAKAK